MKTSIFHRVLNFTVVPLYVIFMFPFIFLKSRRLRRIGEKEQEDWIIKKMLQTNNSSHQEITFIGIDYSRLQRLHSKLESAINNEDYELARVQAELSKGDSEKVKDLISELEALKTKFSFKSKKNQKMYSDVSVLLDKVVDHIKK